MAASLGPLRNNDLRTFRNRHLGRRNGLDLRD